MNTELAVGAAIVCALCNAVAAVLQKVSSDKTTVIESYDDVGVMFKLFGRLPYATAMGLDLLSGICTLVAVNRLPLFIVQAVIASCVVLTAFLEQIFLKRRLSRQVYLAAGVVLAGLGFLALASHSEKTATVQTSVKDAIIATPVLLVIIGAIAVKFKKRFGAMLLSVLSGAAFGGVSVIGRFLVYPTPIWQVVENPLFWALLVYGAVGLFFFTAALQRSLATIVNGVMTSSQTVLPLLVGILFLGDTARNGLWVFVWIGCLLVVSGCGYIAFTNSN